METVAALVEASAAVVVAVVSVWGQVRHRRHDDERFAEVHRKLNGG